VCNSGASKHSMSERRRAVNGEWYTEDEFKTWYGKEKASNRWSEAEEISGTEHSVERRKRLNGDAHMKEEMSQWYGEAADKTWDETQPMDHGDWEQTSNEATDASAAEHGASSPALVVQQSTALLTVEDLPALRKSPHRNHKEARALLQKPVQEPEVEPIDLNGIWKDWRAYIAKQAKRRNCGTQRRISESRADTEYV